MEQYAGLRPGFERDYTAVMDLQDMIKPVQTYLKMYQEKFDQMLTILQNMENNTEIMTEDAVGQRALDASVYMKLLMEELGNYRYWIERVADAYGYR